MASLQQPILAACFLAFLLGVYSSTFTIRNECSYPIWPGILSGAGTQEMSTTRFLLQPGKSTSISVPTSWSGHLWGRTLCTQDSSGKFSCLTRDCDSSTMACSGGGADYVITFCSGLPTRLNLIANAARPVLKDTAAETKPCRTAPPTATSDLVNVLSRNSRRLLGKLPDVNFHAPPSTSNEKSRHLDKFDPPSPPAPTGNPPIHY